MVTARGFPTATLLPDGKVLVAGGNAAGGALDSAELYDPANGTWTTTGRMVTRRTGDTATLLPDGTVLVAGGNDDVGPLDSAELYDPGSGTWSAIVKMLAPRQSHTATLLPDGTVLVAGGDHGVDPPVDTPAEVYDPSSGTSVSANPSASPVPASLQVACDGSTTAISTPLVKAQADGIHIQLANSSGRALTFAIENQFGGESIPVGGGTYVYTFGPGSYRLSCVESGSAFATFEVVDPDGFYTPIACDSTSGGSTIGSTDYVQGATGPKGALLDIARLELRGLQPADVVERAGYSKAAGTQWVRVVRDGHVVTIVGYLDDGHGGWLIGQTGTCSGSNVTVVPPG
jgi:Kelch motif.